MNPSRQHLTPCARGLGRARFRRFARAVVASLVWTASGAWAQPPDSQFSVAIMSDLAYPAPAPGAWSRVGDDPKADAENFIKQRVGAINRRHQEQPLLATFLNGNLTASGRDDQWAFMHDQLKRLKVPALLAQGDRDYQNELDGCGPYQCLHRNVDVLRRYLPTDASLDLDEREYLYGTNVREQRGSLAWSVRLGGVHFVMVNLASRHAVRNSSRYVWQKARTEIVELTSPLPWLAEDLRKARASGLPIVVFYQGERGGVSNHWFSDFMSLLEKYKVGVLFQGGLEPGGGNATAAPKLRTFFTSPNSPQTHLYADFAIKAGAATMKLHRVLWNDQVVNELGEETVVLPMTKEDIPPDLAEGMQEIRFVNNGGYVARFFATHLDSNGQEQRFSSGSLSLGQTWIVPVPRSHGSKIIASAEVMTGLVWSPWHEIFRQEISGDACFKVWGTTLSPSHGRC